MIILIIVVNTTAGIIQEVKVGHAISALTQLTAPDAWVIRDGAQQQIPAADVVTGDLLVLAEGDIVPADAQVTEAAALLADESALTGESVPVDKAPRNRLRRAVSAGTVVVRGRGQAVVTTTGTASAMGRVAALMTAKSGLTLLQLRSLWASPCGAMPPGGAGRAWPSSRSAPLSSPFALGSRARPGSLANPMLPAAIAAALGLQLAGLYVPFLRELLHTQPLTGLDLLVVFVLSSLGYAAIRLGRVLFRRKCPAGPPGAASGGRPWSQMPRVASAISLHVPRHVAGHAEHQPHHLVPGIGGGVEHARAPAVDDGDAVLTAILRGGGRDLAAAVSFLARQPGVQAGKIAVLGESMGGEQALAAVGSDPRIHAVVAEGVEGQQYADIMPPLGRQASGPKYIIDRAGCPRQRRTALAAKANDPRPRSAHVTAGRLEADG